MSHTYSQFSRCSILHYRFYILQNQLADIKYFSGERIQMALFQSFKGQETTNCDNDSTAVMESDVIPPCNCNRIIYIVSPTGRLRVHHRTAISLFQKSLFQGVYKYSLTNFQDTFLKNSRRFLRASYTMSKCK